MTLEQLNVCAAFFGALTALVIFYQWRKQKRNELIATEAREIITLLLKNLASLNHAKDMYDQKQKKELLIEFKDSYLTIVSRIWLISMTIKNTESTSIPLIVSYLKLLNDFQIEVQNVEPKIEEILLKITQQKTTEQNFNDSVEEIKKNTHPFVSHIHPYSIYKKLV